MLMPSLIQSLSKSAFSPTGSQHPICQGVNSYGIYSLYMRRDARKPVFEVSDQKMARGLTIRIEEEGGLYYLCSETNALISCADMQTSAFLMTRVISNIVLNSSLG